MSRVLICVGGPWDGRNVTLQNSWSDSLILPSTEPIEVFSAPLDHFKAPAASVTVKHHVYKVKKIGYGGQSHQTTITVLAYYGRERCDRPESFCL